MEPFATEFTVKHFNNRAAFPAEVFGWLRGIRDSKVLDPNAAHEFDGENVHLIAGSGEELRIRELKRDGDWVAIGFQHDMPDPQGRIWRTEAVLKRGDADTGQDVIRFRTQCLATRTGAFLETPKKPFLIKALLRAEWGGVDGEIDIADEPLWLDDDQADVELAAIIADGEASRWLPIVYVSATGTDQWLLTEDQIKKLSYDLGGVAHVVVEPTIAFSHRLKEASRSRNVYNGTIGVALPGRGFIRRLFLTDGVNGMADLIGEVRSAAVRLRGSMPAVGWDWTELQEHVLRQQRDALRGAVSQGDADQLLDDFTRQLAELQDENRRLTDQLNERAVSDLAADLPGIGEAATLADATTEIYPGELLDRARFAAQMSLSIAESRGVDERSIAVWKAIVERVPRSVALDELLADLARATKNPKRMAGDLTTLLQRHGYRAKSDNKHVRLEADAGFEGLHSITIPKTPSDFRGLKNQRKQIERVLGITKLPGDTRAEETD